MIPDKLQAAVVYLNGKEVVGVADVELPKVEFDTEGLKGFGIGGELDVPNPAALKPMEAKFKFRTVTEQFASLTAPQTVEVEVLGSVQQVNPDKTISTFPIRAFMKLANKSSNPGKMEPSKAMESELTLSVFVYKLEVNGRMVYEIDPAAMKCTINGKDYLAETRKNLGMA